MIRERWNDWPGDAQLSDVITRRVALPVKSIKSKPWPATVLSDLASSVPPLMARVPLFASTRSTFRSIPPIRRLRVPRRDPRHRFDGLLPRGGATGERKARAGYGFLARGSISSASLPRGREVAFVVECFSGE